MAEDDPGEDGDERTIELSALEAIYPEILILPQNHTADNDLKLTLQIQVEPLTPLQIRTPLVSEKTGNLEAPFGRLPRMAWTCKIYTTSPSCRR